MAKFKLVISDFHISRGPVLEDGAPNLLEDFNCDAEFIEFLEYFSSGDYRKAEVELILNGDFLNTLQVDVREENPTVITETLSLAKLKAIIIGHPLLFDALKKFAHTPNHSLTYIPGNHDPAILFPAVRDEFASFLEVEVKYPALVYRFDGFHVEHGNQYSVTNAFEPNNYFLYKGFPEPILNLPWGSHFIIEYLNRIKVRRNVVDKVRPLRRYLRWMLANDTIFGLWAIAMLVVFFIRTRFLESPHRERDLKRTWLILKDAIRIVPNLEMAAKRVLMGSDAHTVIMGHTHVHLHRVFAADKEYFNTGTWNDIVSLNIENLGKQRHLTFVLIEYPAKTRPMASLVEWKGIHRAFNKVLY